MVSKLQQSSPALNETDKVCVMLRESDADDLPLFVVCVMLIDEVLNCHAFTTDGSRDGSMTVCFYLNPTLSKSIIGPKPSNMSPNIGEKTSSCNAYRPLE